MSLAKNRMMVYEDHKSASPFYECFSNVQHGFMKALKNAHLPFMSLSKICITIYEGHKKCSSFARAHQQGASRFYEGGKNAHLRFMSLSKTRISIYEGHMRLHVRLNCRGVALMSKLIGLAQHKKIKFPNGDFGQSHSKTAPPIMPPAHISPCRSGRGSCLFRCC